MTAPKDVARLYAREYARIKEEMIKKVIGDGPVEDWLERISFKRYQDKEDEEFMFIDNRYVCKIVCERQLPSNLSIRVEV